VPVVKYVLEVEISSRTVIPVEERRDEGQEEPPLTAVNKVLPVPADSLLVSLGHEVEILSVQDLYKKG
jgi:hypothetical protein